MLKYDHDGRALTMMITKAPLINDEFLGFFERRQDELVRNEVEARRHADVAVDLLRRVERWLEDTHDANVLRADYREMIRDFLAGYDQ